MGIRTVLDLRGGPIHKPRERRRAEAADMGYISIRLSGIFPPKDRQVTQVLAVMEDPERWPIFLHCWRGDDRVGLVIACYRMHRTSTRRGSGKFSTKPVGPPVPT